MTTILDFGSWKCREFFMVINLLNKVQKRKYTAKFEHEFDMNSMKIALNISSGCVYMYDENGNCAMDCYSSDDLIHLVDNDGQPIDDESDNDGESTDNNESVKDI